MKTLEHFFNALFLLVKAKPFLGFAFGVIVVMLLTIYGANNVASYGEVVFKMYRDIAFMVIAVCLIVFLVTSRKL